MSSVAGLQNIAPVPTSAEFIDVVLNATMRKTPTVIHKNVSPTSPPPECRKTLMSSSRSRVSGTVRASKDGEQGVALMDSLHAKGQVHAGHVR